MAPRLLPLRGMRARHVVVSAVLLLAAGLFGAAWKALVSARAVAVELEHAVQLAELSPRPQATIVFDRHGRPAFSFFSEQRIDVPLDRVAPVMVSALLAVEDQRFFDHRGLDAVRIAGAAWRNARAGRIVEGGSTLTQQLVRTAQLSRERTFARKLREAMIAARLEERYSKQEILEAYLNTVYFGEGFYGVEAAARGYFGKSAADLAAHEAALLAALVRAPSHDAPCVSPKRATARRNLVLRLMRDQQRLGVSRVRAGGRPRRSPTPPTAAARERCWSPTRRAACTSRKNYAVSSSRSSANERVLRGGLRVYSTVRSGAAAGRRNRDHRAHRPHREEPSARARPAGQPGLDRRGHRRRARARRRTRLPRQQLQPRDAGAAAGRVRVQTDPLRGRARARLWRPARCSRRSTCRSPRQERPGCRAASTKQIELHAAAGAEGLEQPRRRAADAAGRHGHDRLLRAAARHRLAAARSCPRSRSAPARSRCSN